MENYFDEFDYEFVENLTTKLSGSIDSIYKGKTIGKRKLKPWAEPDCYLHGFWGEDLHTMSS